MYLIRYEDLSLRPYETVDQLLNYLELKPTKLIDKFLESHTLIQRSESSESGKKNLVDTFMFFGYRPRVQVV